MHNICGSHLDHYSKTDSSDSRLTSVPGLGGLKETKMFLPHPHVKVSIVGSLRDRELACSNPVSGGHCHLNHLTILRRLSWPSLAYMCTKVA